MTTTNYSAPRRQSEKAERSIVVDVVLCAYFAVFPLVVAIFLSAQVARAQIFDHAAPPQVTAMTVD